MQHVYLVPGFFGFANLGDLRYFGHVAHHVARRLEEAGVEAAVHAVATDPTASLAQRAARLLDAIVATAGEAGPIHLVGHSTGGLDARLLVTPGVALPGGRDAAAVAERVASVVSVATPHHGTPVASTFGTLAGKHLLRLLSVSTVLVVRRGALPLSVLVRLSASLERLVRGQAAPDVVDEILDALLREFGPERREAVVRFFEDVGRDQRLLTQLTPAAIDAFNAAAPDRPGVRYGCVVTRARPPSLLGDVVAAGLDPYAHAEAVQWRALWTIASRMPAEESPDPTPEQWQAVVADLGAWPTAADSDGMVPSRSQVRGPVIAAVAADHLDVIGHFHAPQVRPPHYDWIRTGTGFSRAGFDGVWDRVVRWIVA